MNDVIWIKLQKSDIEQIREKRETLLSNPTAEKHELHLSICNSAISKEKISILQALSISFITLNEYREMSFKYVIPTEVKILIEKSEELERNARLQL